MKYFILNNTNFGYNNNSKEYFNNLKKYFYDFFIPYLKKNAKENDKLIHLGGLFNNTDKHKTEYILTVKDIIDKISKILPIFLLVREDKYNNGNYPHKLLSNLKTTIVEDYLEIDNIQFIVKNIEKIKNNK